MTQTNHEIIAEQNDRFRAGDTTMRGQITITRELMQHLVDAGTNVTELAKTVQEFDEFTEDNDPHGEHDFGSFTFAEITCYWKIDLYNLGLDGYSEEPTNPAKTHRVLTIMRAADY